MSCGCEMNPIWEMMGQLLPTASIDRYRAAVASGDAGHMNVEDDVVYPFLAFVVAGATTEPTLDNRIARTRLVTMLNRLRADHRLWGGKFPPDTDASMQAHAMLERRLYRSRQVSDLVAWLSTADAASFLEDIHHV